MRLCRLLIEFEHDRRWVILRREESVDRPSGFRLDAAFDTSDVVAAACATGWVVQRGGECWISDEADCDALGDLVNEMLFYFLRSGEPSPELLDLRERVKPYWHDNGDSRSPLSLWTTACLDLMAREQIADEVLQLEDVWQKPVLEMKVDIPLRESVEQLATRTRNISRALEDMVGCGKMAPSHRTLDRHRSTRTDVG